LIDLNPTVFNAGGVQWDGEYIVVGDLSHPNLYRYAVKGDRGTLASTTHLADAKGDAYFQFAIQGSTLVQPEGCPKHCRYGSNAIFFKYPDGGERTKDIGKGLIAPLGVAVSLAPHRSRSR